MRNKKIIGLTVLSCIICSFVAVKADYIKIPFNKEEMTVVVDENTTVERVEQEDIYGGGNIYLDVYKNASATATTSPEYKAANEASSTLTMSIKNAKHIDLNWWVQSTTTPPTLQWEMYFSNDDGANKNWYPEDGYTTTSNTVITHGTAPLMHKWTYASSTQTYVLKNVGVQPLAAKYMKVEYAVTNANADVYVEGVTQQEEY